ncbi:CPK20 [Symbiodinium sp. CCMP2592]|nr:CPK20 [Symbiodinium sp. CCMP2592]
MPPCERSVCRVCGQNVNLLGLHGLGLRRAWHERRCKDRRARQDREDQPTELLREENQIQVVSKELECGMQQLAAEAQTQSSSLREEVGGQLAQCTSLRAAPSQSEEPATKVSTELESGKQQWAAEAQAESASLHEGAVKLLAESASPPAALSHPEVVSKELECGMQQLAAEAQTQSSSLREEVGGQLAQCTSLRAAPSQSEEPATKVSTELESGKQQRAAEAQAESASLHEGAVKLLAESASPLAALSHPEAQTQSSSLREGVGGQLAQCTSLRAAPSQSEEPATKVSTELESGKQQRAAEAQAESASLHEGAVKLMRSRWAHMSQLLRGDCAPRALVHDIEANFEWRNEALARKLLWEEVIPRPILRGDLRNTVRVIEAPRAFPGDILRLRVPPIVLAKFAEAPDMLHWRCAFRGPLLEPQVLVAVLRQMILDDRPDVLETCCNMALTEHPMTLRASLQRSCDSLLYLARLADMLRQQCPRVVTEIIEELYSLAFDGRWKVRLAATVMVSRLRGETL